MPYRAGLGRPPAGGFCYWPEQKYAQPVEWIWDVSKLILAAGLGFGGGQAAVLVERRRKKKDEEAARTADWQVSHSQGVLYELKNIGTARAKDIVIETDSGRITKDIGQTSLEPGAATGFMFVRHHHSPQISISWTAQNGSPKGPVARLVPPRPRTTS